MQDNSLDKKESLPPSPRKLLVTYALPYANGSLHIGHMAGFIQTDIWVRFQRLYGNTCYFVCGDDAHGTPIMLNAEKKGMTPEALVALCQKEHQADLQDFHISLDNFHSTHSPENQQLVNEIYNKLKQGGDIAQRKIRQAFDPVKNLFLPDRYVKGDCPKCGASDQYGDGCEICGSIYGPTDLKNPISAISGATPIEKETLHDFFCLEHYETFLKNWTQSHHVQVEVAKKLKEWFDLGLKQWDITRDAPYFGFEIPKAPGKYFYVWLDAPIGYMASFKHFCDRQSVSQEQSNQQFEAFWGREAQTELYHFIGKDIIYFHTLFWPAVLQGSGSRTPTGVYVHGFVTVNGQKMSKSRGTFIEARTYLNHFNPELLRYYFASKFSSGIVDIDFQAEDFVQRINADLVGKLINIASRCAGFITQHFSGVLSKECQEIKLYEHFVAEGKKIAKHFEDRELSHAIREIMLLADQANRYIDEKKPWALAKDPQRLSETQAICSVGLNLFRLLMIYLQPILPRLAEEVETFLNTQLSWESRLLPLVNHPIQPFKPLLQRIDIKQVSAMIEASKEQMAETVEKTKPTPSMANTDASLAATIPAREPIRDTIDIQDFEKVDLRIVKILNAEEVPEADKLLKLTVDIGEGETRQVFAGIKGIYQPADLIGKSTLLVANLAPRKMRFGISEGMLLVAGAPGKGFWLLEPQAGAEPGMRVK